MSSKRKKAAEASRIARANNPAWGKGKPWIELRARAKLLRLRGTPAEARQLEILALDLEAAYGAQPATSTWVGGLPDVKKP